MSKEYWKETSTTVTMQGAETFYVCPHCKSVKTEHERQENWHYCPLCGFELEYPDEN